jgi:sodium transport system permease protein
MLERIGVVLRKELLDNLRDRRTLVTSLLTSLLGPFMLFLLLTVIGQTAGERAERPLELPVADAERAPGLMAFLEQRNVIVRPAPADPEAAVRAGEVDVVLVVGEEYAERLQARGVSPSLVVPLAVEEADVATPESRAAQLLNVLPYFLIFSVFVGGMGLTIDVTAGERERGSLEPLLLNPVRRGELVIAKLLAGLLPTAMSVIVGLAGFAAVINLVPLGAQLGVRLSLGLPALLAIFLIALPIMLLAGALQMIIATSSRTVKEAQSYLAFLPLIPALPGLFLAFLPLRPAMWQMLVPTFGQQVLINQLMRGEPIDPLFTAVSAAVTLAIGLLLALVAMRLFGREQVLFGRGE